MKKYFILLLVFILTLGLIGCNEKDTKADQNENIAESKDINSSSSNEESSINGIGIFVAPTPDEYIAELKAKFSSATITNVNATDTSYSFNLASDFQVYCTLNNNGKIISLTALINDVNTKDANEIAQALLLVGVPVSKLINCQNGNSYTETEIVSMWTDLVEDGVSVGKVEICDFETEYGIGMDTKIIVAKCKYIGYCE